MKTFLKVIFGAIGLVILLLVVAAVVLPLVYDKEDLKHAITAEVQRQTGRELVIGGALDFSVFPWLAVEVADLNLSNAPGFGEKPFARIGKARVGVALIPLFSHQLTADEITLDGLELSLAVNSKGKNNWDDLAGEREAAKETESVGPGLFSSGRIAGLNLNDAQLEYQDQQSGSHYRLHDLNLKTGALGDGRPVDLKLTLILEDVSGGTRTDMDLSATSAVDLEQRQYDLSNLQLELNTLSQASGAGETVTVIAPALAVNLDKQTLEMGAFSVAVGALKGSGDLSASKILDKPAFKGAFRVEGFSPARLMQDLAIEVPRTTDPNVLQHMQLSTQFSGTDATLQLSSLQMELDQSHFDGELSVKNFDRPAIRFDFKVDSIDIDRYLEPAPEDTETAQDVAIPKDELQDRDLQGTLRVAALRLAKVDFSDAVLGLKLSQGKLRLNPLTARFYDGTYSGNVSLDGSGAVPVVSLDEKIDSITLQRMLADITKTESLSGTAMGYARLTGRGASSNAVLSSLDGDVGLNLTEGAYEGVNVWYEIRRAYALFKGLPPPPPEPDRTVFSRLRFDAGVQNGVLTTREMAGELPFLKLRGDGNVDLGQSNVDLQLVAVVRDAPELSKDPLTAELRGKKFPFRISGPLESPKISVDWASLLQGEATDLLLKKLDLKSRLGANGASSESAPENDTSGDSANEPAAEELQPEDAATSLIKGLLKPKKKKKPDDDSGQ